MISTILFDLDHTLIYLEPRIRYQAVRETLKELGEKNWSERDVDYFWVRPNRSDIVKSHGIDPTKFWAVFNKVDAVDLRIKHTKTYPDVWILNKLKEKGVRLGVVSGTVPWLAEPQLRLFGNGMFEEVVICHPTAGIAAKPAPDGLELCIRNMKVDKKTTAYVGNSDEDILAARAAGVLDILVRRKPEFIDEKASVVIDNLEELLEMV
jgi:phosphoglycolate phosphatase-like HAD superfamily hydrolase